jgi:flavin-dependent dehydrogenase
MVRPNLSYDVAVIGGGPAGTTLATFLVRQGHRCLVVENTPFPRYHIGESLIPHTYGTFQRLGLLPKLRASQFPKKYSVRFVSPEGDEAQPFYFFETVPGERAQTWQVERSAFDQICLEHAIENGVEVKSKTTVEKVLFDGERASGLQLRLPSGCIEFIRTRVVVDASGRATVLGNQLGLKGAVPGLNKASVWSYYRGGQRLEGLDGGETTVFMLPGRGWFWYIPLPDDVVSVGVVADPAYLFDESTDFEAVFLREVERCGPLKARLATARQIGPVRGLRRLAYRNRRVAGDGWVMVGDAAAFLDPIYSSGLYLALGSAELAAGCIHEALTSGDCSAARLGAYVPSLMAGVEIIRRLIHAFYDPSFSFREFVERFPEHKPALIDCLIGDVVNKDMNDFLKALATMTPPPVPLGASAVAAATAETGARDALTSAQ